MKMNDAQIERTLHQFEAKAIPPEHPVLQQLERLFGEHTYFLDRNGLNIVEPVETEKPGDEGLAVVVNLANWADENSTSSLQAHEPESTDILVNLEADQRH